MQDAAAALKVQADAASERANSTVQTACSDAAKAETAAQEARVAAAAEAKALSDSIADKDREFEQLKVRP